MKWTSFQLALYKKFTSPLHLNKLCRCVQVTNTSEDLRFCSQIPTKKGKEKREKKESKTLTWHGLTIQL